MYHHPQPFTPDGKDAHLQRGDVVLFRFPLAEEDDDPGAPKRRPCLVLDTLTAGDDRFVEIAYGTSADTTAKRSSGTSRRAKIAVSTLSPQLLTPEADRLSNALAVVIELYATLSAVHDILRAEKALEGLRVAA